MIPSLDAAKIIQREREDAIVVTHMTPSRYWGLVSEKPEMDLPIYGAMSKASSVGLGLALARPDKRIIILDGDGSLLMNLGSLVTAAGKEPRNLVHIVFDDGVYFTTGGQPVPGNQKYNLSDIARASGITNSYEFDNLEDFASELPAIMDEDGPIFICLKVSHPSENVPEFKMGNTKLAMRRLSAMLADS